MTRRQKLSKDEQQVALKRAITHDVWSGDLAPGLRLIEADFAARYAVSRSLVRETFRDLASDGLLELVPNRGALVRRLSGEDMRNTISIYRALSSMALRSAVEECRDAGGRVRFRARSCALWNAAPKTSFKEISHVIVQCHRALFTCQRNPALCDLAPRLQFPLILVSLRSAVPIEVLSEALRDLEEMARALLAGCFEEALVAMNRHLARIDGLAAEVRPFEPTPKRPMQAAV